MDLSFIKTKKLTLDEYLGIKNIITPNGFIICNWKVL